MLFCIIKNIIKSLAYERCVPHVLPGPFYISKKERRPRDSSIEQRKVMGIGKSFEGRREIQLQY
jgi:hypothetical protein